MSDYINENKTNGLLGELRRIAAAGRNGDAGIDFDRGGFSAEDKEIAGLINEICGNYRTAVEYDLMKYKLANDALGIALWDMDIVTEDPVSPENKLVWSQEVRDMLGFADENEFPNSISALADRFHPDDSVKVFAAFAAHFNDKTGKTPYDIEYRLKHKNGEYRYYRGIGTTKRDSSGTPLRISGAVIDIDEEKRTQNHLKIMSSIVHHSPNFISYKRIKGDCLYVNPAATSLTGYTEEELKADYYGSLFDDETAESIKEQVTRDLSENGISHYEYKAKTKTGAERVCSGTSIMIEEDAYASIASDITEDKKIEAERIEMIQELKRSKEQTDALNNWYRSILNSIPLPITVTDSNMNWTFVNTAVEDFLGTKLEDMLGKPCSNWDAHICNTPACGIACAKRGEKRTFFTHNGVSYQVDVAILKNIDDSTAGFIEVVQDITMLKEAEALKRSREADEYIQLMFNAMPLCANYWTRDHKIEGSNDEIVRLFGLADKREFADRFSELLPEYQPDGRPSGETVKMLVTKAYDDGYCRFEFEMRKLNGEPLPVDVSLIRIKRGDDYIVVAYFLDLREFKKLISEVDGERQKFIEMAHWYESILDAMPFALTVQDSDKILRFINATTEKVFNKKRSELIGKPCRLINFGICGTENCVIECAKRGHMRAYFTHEDNSFQADTTILKDLQGWSTGYIEVIQDITKMEHISRQQAEAEAANNAKSSFLAIMSHEMRTPLNAIIGMTSIGKNARDIERKDYALNNIGNASANLLNIINDVLDMSKIEADKMELSPVEYNIEGMLKKVLSVVKFRLDEKKQRFSLHMDAKVPHFIIGDDQRLSQVITNLLSNASKFTHQGGDIQLKISLEEETDKICTLRFEAADNGIGISPEQQEKLFVPFTQAESGTSRMFGGTGLGLALCRRIIELMGGKIWIESELGKGSRFIFTVKAARGSQHLLSLLSPGIKLEDLHVMVVDDEKIILKYFADALKNIGVKCSTALSGEEALRVSERDGPFGIYLIDWVMEGMDGIELAKLIKEKESKKGRNPVITMISGFMQSPDKEELEAAGIEKYLVKPVFTSTIIELINECLDIESARHEESFMDETRDLFEGKRLLIAEDVEMNREIVITLLSDTGLVIDEAGNGLEALKMVEANPGRYDLVFMDMQMPQMDGLEATRQIRALPAEYAKTLPIIAMTANVFKEDIDKCLSAGMDGHLGKPLDMDIMLSVLKKYLK